MLAEKSRKSLFRSKYFIAGCIAAGIGCLALAVYVFALTIHVRSRLSHRRWQIPSRVYSDSEILFPGERIGRKTFIRMLKMRGYRNVPHLPRLPGRFMCRGNRCLVFLRDFVYPDRRFKGFVLEAEFRGNAINWLQKNGETLDLVSLEPVEITRLYGKEKEARDLISCRQIPKYLISAIVNTEDRRFFKHRGVDWRGILRALLVDLKSGRVIQGGSTITQQLVKNYFLRPERSLTRKMREALIALIIESLYSKKDILEMYMNEIYMGQGNGVSINGMGEATRYYFGHNVTNLTLAEAAMLAGLIRAPNHYSPFLHPARAKRRRNLVLKEMLKAGLIAKQAFQRALNAPLVLSPTPGLSKENLYYVDFLKRQLEAFYPKEALTGQGLQIFTALQPEFQEAAVKAVRHGLKHLEQKIHARRHGKNPVPLQAAMIVVRPKTGEILAMVGGRNYAKSPFNRAMDAHRQSGSLFKPFVYLTALNTFTPASVIYDGPIHYTFKGKSWTPHNYDRRYHGRVTLRTALAFSLNAATANLAMKVGLKKIIETARSLGVTSTLSPYPSLALGSFEMTPLELAQAYCLFAGEGQLPFLLTLRDVLSETGKLEQKKNITVRTVCTPAKAYLVTSMLEDVVRYGTAKSLRSLGILFPCAGKTGTTSEYRDSWFAGFTQDILAVVWVGYDNNRNTHLSGATGAMVLWADFMKRVKNRLNPQPFIRPPGVVSRWVNVDVNWPPESIHPKQYEEVFLEGNVPSETELSERRQRRHRGGSLIKDLLKGIWRGVRDVFQ